MVNCTNPYHDLHAHTYLPIWNKDRMAQPRRIVLKHYVKKNTQQHYLCKMGNRKTCQS